MRLDDSLKKAFAEAAQRENTTPSRMMRVLMEDFVKASRRREAQRQSRLVAAASDAKETMDDVMRAQDWIDG